MFGVQAQPGKPQAMTNPSGDGGWGGAQCWANSDCKACSGASEQVVMPPGMLIEAAAGVPHELATRSRVVFIPQVLVGQDHKQRACIDALPDSLRHVVFSLHLDHELRTHPGLPASASASASASDSRMGRKSNGFTNDLLHRDREDRLISRSRAARRHLLAERCFGPPIVTGDARG